MANVYENKLTEGEAVRLCADWEPKPEFKLGAKDID